MTVLEWYNCHGISTSLLCNLSNLPLIEWLPPDVCPTKCVLCGVYPKTRCEIQSVPASLAEHSTDSDAQTRRFHVVTAFNTL